MKKVYGILLVIMMVCVGCEWQLRPNTADSEGAQVTIERYDRIETLYLTTGDYSALQQMNTTYPMQTRMLIEDMLHIGKVNDPEINTKFLHFFQDSTLQNMLDDVQEQYADMDDICNDINAAFSRLKELLPSMEFPTVYTQVGSFDQSIIVGTGTLGISLDKYLGADYPFYRSHYTEEQRRMMERSMIIPDCLVFYILSLYPMPNGHQATQEERDQHMGKIQWVVNHVTRQETFKNAYVEWADRLMKHHKKMNVEQLLQDKP